MKPITRFIYCLLIVLFINPFVSPAQLNTPHNAKGPEPKNSSRHLVERILEKQYIARNLKSVPAGKTTSPGAHERLIAYSGYNFQDTNAYFRWVISDSGNFYYTGMNGSVFNYQAVSYSLVNYPYAGLPETNLNSPTNMYLGLSPFKYQGVEVMHDSEAIWNDYCTDTTAHFFGLFGRTDYSYSGSNIATLQRPYTQPYSYSKYREQLEYDTLGRMVALVQSSFDTATSAWDTNYIRLSYYDTSGNMVMDSSSSNVGYTGWYPEEKNIYAYDLFHNVSFSELFLDSNITSGIWQPYQKLYLTYNTDFSLHTDSISMQGSGSSLPYIVDSFGYSTGISYYTYHQMLYYLSGPSFEKVVGVKHVSFTSLPDTVYYQYYSNYPAGGVMKMQSAKKSPFAYDSYNNPVWASMFNYIITDSISGAGYYDTATEREFHYYYETYGAALATQNIKPHAERITLYPNPTTGIINIFRPDAVKGSATVIRISNISGKTLRTESLPWMNVSETVSLVDLPNGTYIIALEEKGIILFTQKVVKL